MYKKVYNILEKKQKRFFLLLLLLILINAVFETIGVAAIIPLITLIIEDDFANKYSYMSNFLLIISETILPKNFYENNITQNNLAIGGFISFLILIFIKNIYFIFLNYLQQAFTNNLNFSISKKLFSGYLNLNYIFHTMRHSSNLEHNVLTETNAFTNVFNAMLTIITEIIILIFLTTLLLFYDFYTSIFIFLFLIIISYSLFSVTKSKLTSWGSIRIKNMDQRHKHLMEGLSSIQEIYILRKSLFFLGNFVKHSKKYLNANIKFHTTLSANRPIFEFVGILTLTALFLVMLFQGNSIETLLITLGLFLGASFKLLPSLNKLISGYQNFKFSYPSIDRIFQEFDIIKKNNQPVTEKKDFKFEKELKVKNISFAYPNKDALILDDVSFSITKGTKIGIKGGSGSGKSTLINLILTLIEPTKGQIIVDKWNLEKNNLNWLKNIGFVSQETNLIDDTIAKNIAFGLDDEEIDQDKLDKAIHDAKLKNFIDSSKKGIHTKVGEKGQMISGGQKQRIGIARALYNDPEVLILDEPTSSLDIETEKSIMETIYNLKMTILIVSHRESTLKNCDRILNITNGKVEEK